jgi:adenylosuccinate lyase
VAWALAVTAATLERIALEVRHLARTEVREVEEPFERGQKGSSAMPHKRNPILSERICGLARVVRANLQAALEDIALWHERDISHSSVERIIFPDTTIVVDYMLSLAIRLIDDLRVFPERMRANLEATGGLLFSQGVLLSLIDRGLPRDEAYALVQDAAARAWDEEESFHDVLERGLAGRVAFSAEEFDALFDPVPFVRNLDGVFARLEKLEVSETP